MRFSASTASSQRRARIRFLPTVKGGRSTPPVSGFRPQIRLDGVQTSCVVESGDVGETFSFGVDSTVVLTLVFPDEYGHQFAELGRVELFEGNRLIATGDFLD